MSSSDRPTSEPSAVSTVLEALRRHPRLGPQIAHVATLPGQEAAFADLEPPLPAGLARALEAAGAPRLWRHQAEGLQALRAGENVLVTTPTASGKSLVFHLPVLEEAARGGAGTALFLYPLKALGQDQRAKLEQLAIAAGIDAPCAIYDGDTPVAARAKLRRHPPRVLVTNPDMLHLGILPSWMQWAPFLSELSWIVLDELHTYRGIFGSHFHHVLQRLLRLSRALGAEPRLVASSATAGNAEEFAKALTGMTFRRVADSGAPREPRSLVLVQPSASPYTTALQLLVELLRQGLKTIVFTKARRVTELLYSWLRRQEPELARRVASYRAGFLPEERRRIEAELFAGTLQGVISTSALEMGIDVGGLDACILVGWPGSVMATWQRSGRVGRQGRESLTLLVALPDALDQWLVRHPEELLARPCEPLVVDPGNEPVARQHLPCAAAEEPLDREIDGDYLLPHGAAVERLLGEHHLRASEDGRQLFARARRPHRGVSLRGGGETVAIVEAGRQRVIGTVDGARVLRECHPGAVYLHAGRQYVVRELDLSTARAVVEPAAVDWYTAALTEKDTRILEILGERHDGPLSAWLGRLEVTERVVGYERKRIFGQEVLSQHALELPSVTFETVGLWWVAKPSHEDVLRQAGRHVLGSLHAAEHTTIALLPLLALCDRNDIGGISMPFHPQVGCGCVFVYDGHAGGVGIAARGFSELPELLGRVAALLDECPCEEGCPSCVQSPKCGNGNRPLDKLGARRVLALLLGEEVVGEDAQAPWRLPEVAEEVGDSAERRDVGPLPEPTPSPMSAPTPAPTQTAVVATPELLPRTAPAPGTGAFATGPGAGGVTVDGDVAAAEVEVAASFNGHHERRNGRGNGFPGQPIDRHDLLGNGDGSRPAESQGRGSVGRHLSVSRELPVSTPSFPAAGRSGAPLPSALLRWWRALRQRLMPRNGHATAAAPPPTWRSPASFLGGRTVLFDLETQRSAAEVGGWGNAHRMGVSLAVLCHLEEDRFEVYGEDRVRELAEALRTADLVIGYNLRRFDYRVLAGYTGADYNRLVPTLDLLEEIHRALGFRLRLDELARETLGSGKSADGLQCLEWVRDGRLDLVEAYCRRDVEVLRDVYLFGRREGYVLYRDRQERRVRLPVRW
jgi:DEAD/DEAH box helicase domain-containing protein